MKIVKIVMMTSLVLNITFAQKASKVPTAHDLLTNVVKEFEAVQDFTATINAEVNMERVQIPKMSATLYFKKPNKIQFSSQSFLLVPRDGIALNPAVLWEGYDASFMGEDSLNGRMLYKLQLAAKEKKTRLRQLYVWIDPAHWIIARTETIPYEGRTLSMAFTYACQQEKYWLPSQLIVSFGSTTEGEKASADSISQQDAHFGHVQRGEPKNGSVTIQYSNYRVNVDLDDSIFEKKEK